MGPPARRTATTGTQRAKNWRSGFTIPRVAEDRSLARRFDKSVLLHRMNPRAWQVPARTTAKRGEFSRGLCEKGWRACASRRPIGAARGGSCSWRATTSGESLFVKMNATHFALRDARLARAWSPGAGRAFAARRGSTVYDVRGGFLVGRSMSASASGGPAARSLAPREHGAYGQMCVPLVAGLLLGRPSLSALGFAIGAMALFFAHEPLLVALGQRGARARREDGPRALRRFGWLSAAALVFGGAGFVLAENAARLAGLGPMVPFAVVVALVFREQEKTPLGEVLAAAALSGAGFPVAVAGGVDLARAATAWGVWTAAFMMSTLAVHAVLARSKRLGLGMLAASVGTSVFLLGSSLALAARGALPWAAPLSLAPFFLLALAVSVFPVHTRHLRRVGFGLVGASVATLVLLVATLR